MRRILISGIMLFAMMFAMIPASMAQATAPSWSTPVDLPTDLGQGQAAYNHRIAVSPDNGNIVSVWVQHDNDPAPYGGPYVVQASVSEDDGQTWSKPENISEMSYVDQGFPYEIEITDLTVSNSGVFLAVWSIFVDDGAGGTEVVQASTNPGGEPEEGWSWPSDLSDRSAGNAWDASAAVSTNISGEDEFIVVWNSDSAGLLSIDSLKGTYNSVAEEIDWDANGPSPVSVAPNSSAINNQGAPEIAFVQGLALVAWAESIINGNLVITQATSQNSGASWSTPAAISNPNFDSSGLSIALSAASGNPMAVGWSQWDTTDEFQISTFDGQAWSNPQVVSDPTMDTDEGRVVVDSTNHFVAVWGEDDPLSQVPATVFARASDFDPTTPSFSTWSSPVVLSDPSFCNAYLDDVTVSTPNTYTADQFMVAMECDHGGPTSTQTAQFDSSLNATTSFVTGFDDNYYAQVAPLDGVGFITQWTHEESIVQNSITTDGQNWTDAFSVSTLGQGASDSPRIAVSPAGDYVAVWLYNSMYNRREVVAATSPDGINWTAVPGSATDDPATDSNDVQIAVDDDGNFVIVWNQWDATSDNLMLHSVYGGADPSTWQESSSPISTTSQSADSATLSVNADGTFFIAWMDTDSHDVEASVSLDHGATWNTSFIGASGWNSFPSVTMTSNENFVVAWVARDSNNQLYISTLALTGVAQPQNLTDPQTDGDCSDAHLTRAGANLIAAWACYDVASTDTVIYSATSTDGGASWTNNPNPIFAGHGTGDIRLAGNENGRAAMVWVYYNSANNNVVTQTTLSEDGGETWSISTRLSGLTGNAIFPQLSVNADGEFAAMWSEDYELHESTLPASGSTSWSPPSTLNSSGNVTFVSLAPVTTTGSVGFASAWYNDIYSEQNTAQVSLLLSSAPAPGPTPSPTPTTSPTTPSPDPSSTTVPAAQDGLALTGLTSIFGVLGWLGMAGILGGGAIALIRALLTNRAQRRQ